jgi:predicted permease
MSWFSALRHRLVEAVRPTQADQELQEELRDHFEREVQRQLRNGVDAAEARRVAAIRAGGPLAAREAVRDGRTGRLLQDLAADLRFAVRALRRAPGFAAAVVVSLALGVGGTTAMFGVVEAVLVRPLPYAEADRLFNLRIWWNDFSSTLSPADFNALEDLPADGITFGAYFRPYDGFAMTTPSGPELVSGAIVTPGLLRTLRTAPVAGPGFSQTPNAREALIGERLWRERFGASPAAIGQSIVLDGDAYTITGVMPAGFNVPGQRDGAAWLKALSRQPTSRGPFYLTTIVRVRSDLTPQGAAATLTAGIRPVLRDKYGVEPNWEYRLRPLKDVIVGDVRQTLGLLLGATCLVLLIAVVNVTNLMLARGTARSLELAIRASLGAGRSRLTRHVLVESAVLGVLGGLAGLGIVLLIHAAVGLPASTVVPRLEELRLDSTLALFAVACGLGAGLLAGVLPALRLPWARLGGLLRDGGRSGEGPARGRVRQVLVVAEIALTVTVLTGAVLLAKSFVKLQEIDPGFEPANVASFRLSLPDEPYGNDEARLAAFVADLEQRLGSAPSVSSVAFSFGLPPDLLVLSNNYTIEGAAGGTAGPSGVAEWNVITGAYFATMGIRIIEGRTFESGDHAEAPEVAIVNEAFVRRHYPDGRAIGRRFKGGDWDPSAPWNTIVGVVADVPYGRGLWGGADATVYRPYAQNLWVQSPYVVIKVGGDPGQARSMAQQIVAAIDPSLPLRNFATMDQRVHDSMLEPRLRSRLLALIAGLALALSMVGIHGVMAYYVQHRRREMAIRRALGAPTSDVVGAVVVVGLRMAGAGLVLGGLGALVLSRSLSSLLFHVSPRDPGALVTVAGLLAIASVLACAVPALRTAAIEPALVLRDE